MTFTAYIVFAIVLFLAIQYNKLIDRERMYKEYFNFAVNWMFMNKFDPIEIYQRMRMKHGQNFKEEIAKEAIEDAFVHIFRTLGVKIENLTILWE